MRSRKVRETPHRFTRRAVAQRRDDSLSLVIRQLDADLPKNTRVCVDATDA
jgi:hypothetical protein